MKTPPPPFPSLRRLGGSAVAVSFGALALLLTPVDTPPAAPIHFVDWWTEVGTARAAIGLVRLAGLAIAAWTLLLIGLGLAVAGTRSLRLARAWIRLAPQSLRRTVAVSMILGTVSTPGAALADDGTAEVIVLVDLGPVDGPASVDPPGPILTDLGPLADVRPPPGDDPAPRSVAHTETPGVEQWTVARGDHLWHIAEETLRDRGQLADVAAVTRYWARLIENNRLVIGEDADLIHPGLVLTLPA